VKINIAYWVFVRQHEVMAGKPQTELTDKKFVGEYETHAKANAIVKLAHEAEYPRKGLYTVRAVDLNKVTSRRKENKYE